MNKDNRFKDHKIRKSVRRIEEQVVSMALFSQGLIAVMTNNKGIKVFSFAAKLNDVRVFSQFFFTVLFFVFSMIIFLFKLF